MTLAFGGQSKGTVIRAIRNAITGFDSLAIAVSYVQMSGWDLLRPLIASKAADVRLICTDQLGITDPSAIRAMQDAGIIVHAYTGTKVFHPKVFIASTEGKADRWILGSANLSRSALHSGVEAVFANDDDGDALTWFDGLFANESEPFDDGRLNALENAFSARLTGSLAAARVRPLSQSFLQADIADAETVEAAFAALPDIVVPLNADKAGNNVRTLRRIKEVLDNPAELQGKALSEFKLIGLAQDGDYSALGQTARYKSLPAIADLWSKWLKHAARKDVDTANPSGRLAQARVAFETFWSFPAEVRDYFLDHATAPAANIRPHLQTIELLANTGRKMPTLTVEDIRTLSGMLGATSQLPRRVRKVVEDYLANKGTRGWSEPDRNLILQAWNRA